MPLAGASSVARAELLVSEDDMMALVRSVVALLLGTAALVLVEAAPAHACSCGPRPPVGEALAGSDGAFIGVFTGRDDPVVQGALLSSARPVLNHFEVEHAVKGDIGERIGVTSAASGGSCGLEVEVGERIGVLVRRVGDGWASSLCSQTSADALLGFVPAEGEAAATGAGGDPAAPESLSVGAWVAFLGPLVALAVAAWLGLRRKTRPARG